MSDGWPTPPPVPSPIAGAGALSSVPFQKRQGQVDRERAALARVFEHQAFILITGTGTTTQDVRFPVRFIEMPALSHGWSLEDGQQLLPDSFPCVNVGVARWLYEEHPMQVRYYVGATVAISASGRPDQRMVVHVQVVGRTVGVLGGAADQSADGVL